MNMPWLVISDFNSPLSLANKQGGLPIVNHGTIDFQDFVLQTDMEDLHSLGCQYTWINGRVYFKFDRALVTNYG